MGELREARSAEAGAIWNTNVGAPPNSLRSDEYCVICFSMYLPYYLILMVTKVCRPQAASRLCVPLRRQFKGGIVITDPELNGNLAVTTPATRESQIYFHFALQVVQTLQLLSVCGLVGSAPSRRRVCPS